MCKKLTDHDLEMLAQIVAQRSDDGWTKFGKAQAPLVEDVTEGLLEVRILANGSGYCRPTAIGKILCEWLLPISD